MADDSTPAAADFQQTMASMMHAVHSEDYDAVIRLFFEGDSLLQAQIQAQPQLTPQLETMRGQLRQMAERAWSEMLSARARGLEELIVKADVLIQEVKLDGARQLLGSWCAPRTPCA